MVKALAVVNMQRGFDIDELLSPVNEVISFAERNDFPIIFTMDDFGEDEYEEPWELSPRLDVQGDYFAKSEGQYEELVEDLQIDQAIVVGNLTQGAQYVKDGVRVTEASRGELDEGVEVDLIDL